MVFLLLRPRHAATVFLAMAFFAAPLPSRAAEPTREQLDFFEKMVRPVLVEHCYRCHSEEAGKKRGGLVVDSAGAMRAGGDTGPALVPGEPDSSLLIEAIRYTNEDLRMPPKGKLPDEAVASLTRWVKMGAPWPGGSAKTNRRTPGTITDEDRKWWAFQPVRAVSPPAAGEGWVRNEIDRFVAARLAGARLTPAPEADRVTLIRRLTFDLWGLPPSPEEINAFLADTSAGAYERLVDRLLSSPRYGERWARYWLDLVRYADSDGYRIDDYRPNAWRYRDYVIRALNNDKPYDRFVQEQLAGDELFPGDPEALIATGYLRHGIYEYNSRDVRGQWNLILDDITDTTGDVFLGLGIQCARCHDHKFDPILQKDYYRLQAFFANILPREDLLAATPAERQEHARRMKVWEEKTAEIRAEIDRLEAPYRKRVAHEAIIKFPEDIQEMIRKPVSERTPLEHQLAELAYRQVTYEYDRLERNFKGEEKERIFALRRKLAEFDKLKPPPLPVAFSATDVGRRSAPAALPKKPDEEVEPGFLTILAPAPAVVEPLAGSSGRRATLAKWLTRPDNPLTGRVLVNRLWQQHFGHGLASNASDFGKLGDPPSHPELLDWLAARFVRDGWSLKKLHRLIVTSATYRQSATHPEPDHGKLLDPENRLLWRGNVRRLDAEQIRDAIYAVTGELDLKAGGPGATGNEPRRAIYTRVMRNSRDPLLDVFDAPFWFNSASSRDTTTTPVQSLLLFNSSLMLRRSKAFADRLAREQSADETARIVRAYQLAFGRSPGSDEIDAARLFLKEQVRRIDVKEANSAQAAFLAGKIAYRDGQAAEVKLDEKAVGFHVPLGEHGPKTDFTVETFVTPRSVADTGTVRTVAAQWDGDSKHPGWAFGITGKKSRRKPQTLVIQLFGKKRNGSFGEEAIFSDQHVQLHKPYYIAAAVKFATPEAAGEVIFYLKDLSNDDEPLLIARVTHEVISLGGQADVPLTLGCRSGRSPCGFDGVLDDVRLSAGALGVDKLLFTHEGAGPDTIGYWQFEAKPDVFHDAGGHGLRILPTRAAPRGDQDPKKAAWSDFCQVLLNASEFLYVE